LKKNTLKFVVNVALFVDMCSLSVIGLFLGFVIPRGRGYGFQKYFLGLQRHQWGDIHLYLSLLLLILLVFHICFNWTWVVRATKNYFGERWKNFLFAISCGWIIVLIVGWIVVKF
jgi:signal transduction histidine kinase